MGKKKLNRVAGCLFGLRKLVFFIEKILQSSLHAVNFTIYRIFKVD